MTVKPSVPLAMNPKIKNPLKGAQLTLLSLPVCEVCRQGCAELVGDRMCHGCIVARKDAERSVFTPNDKFVRGWFDDGGIYHSSLDLPKGYLVGKKAAEPIPEQEIQPEISLRNCPLCSSSVSELIGGKFCHRCYGQLKVGKKAAEIRKESAIQPKISLQIKAPKPGTSIALWQVCPKQRGSIECKTKNRKRYYYLRRRGAGGSWQSTYLSKDWAKALDKVRRIVDAETL